MSLRKRLTLYCAAGIALVLIIGSAATYLIMRAQLRQQVDNVLRQQSSAVFVSGEIPSGKSGANPASPLQVLTPKSGTTGAPKRARVSAPRQPFGSLPAFIELIDSKGRVSLPEPNGVHLPISARAREVAQSGKGAYFTDVHLRGTHLRMRVQPSSKGHALVVAQSLADVDRAVNRLAWSLGTTGVLGTILAALLAMVVARGALLPIRRLNETASRVASTRNLSERIPVSSDDELSRLSATFNTMLDSLETAVDSQRRLVADASHELRTPLTSLRTNIDVLRQGLQLEPEDRDKLLADVTRELEDLAALVANLVDLARGSQRDLHLAEVRLDEIAEAVVIRARARFPRLSFTLAATPTTVLGDSEELERAAWNLVENAAKWSAAEAVVEIAVADEAISVRDHGPGVSAADRPFIFDRFYRADGARGKTGSGLGLAIVRQVAESHGGRVEVEDAEGGGARFRLALLRS